MEELIRVKVIDIGRKNLVLRWVDPESGREKQKSARTSNRKTAERVAGELEADLRKGRYEPPSRLSWEVFRERFEQEKLAILAPGSMVAYASSLNVMERYLNPAKVSDLTASRISYFQSQLIKNNARPATVARHLRHLKSVLNWGKDVGLINRVPKIKTPKQLKGAKLMRGRPLTDEEFQRMLDAVPEVVGDELAEGWKYFLEGLWWSGLRVSEAINLYWDRRDRLSVDFTGDYPMFRILAEYEKGKRDRILPMAPEFAQFLDRTPQKKRTGRIFEPAGNGVRRLQTHYSKRGSLIGQAAGVVVDETDSYQKPRYATLHDLRRSFGERWAQRILPQQLMELMRHESIETTLKFYVGANAARTAEALWEHHINIGTRDSD
ncbi:tyrosine-type recombinase/integrase [Bremerella sp. T1]|uniref:tyrosine-type recombinase/integrase n=1 Tax=Bremerella sp. TYQ1 TaxID=3119568 RepID=UPI001CCF7C23|nr:site-specific integrase [Bremerella volcania]UBM38166.1 site-specific integrase [Bremerella volcania]